MKKNKLVAWLHDNTLFSLTVLLGIITIILFVSSAIAGLLQAPSAALLLLFLGLYFFGLFSVLIEERHL